MRQEKTSLLAYFSPTPTIGTKRSLLTRSQFRLIGLILIASLGDATSTLWGLHVGLVEQNPLMDSLLNASWLGFTFLKALIPLAVFLGALWLSSRVDSSRSIWLLLGVRYPARVAWLMIVLYGGVAIYNTVLVVGFVHWGWGSG